MTEVALIFGFFFHSTSYVFIVTKIGWATYWATFSQTHQVTLVSATQQRNEDVFEFLYIPMTEL
jgi:hypothetical protein